MAAQSHKKLAKLEDIQLGNRLSRSEFDEDALGLRQALLAAQFAVQEAEYPVLVIIGGLDGAGKGSAVHRLNEWMDPRGIETEGFWLHSDEEESRPYFWRFWRRLPPAGQIGLYINGWYARPGSALLTSNLSGKALRRRCEEINRFESAHYDDGALIVKLWLHVGKKAQKLQLAEQAPRMQQNPRVPRSFDHHKVPYKKQMKSASRLLAQTDSASCPWHVIDAEDRFHRDITLGRILLEQMEARTAQQSSRHAAAETTPPPLGKLPKTAPLDRVDLDQSLKKSHYREKLAKYQGRLQDLAWKRHASTQRSLVAVFEGWDAAGKGSAIRRVTGAIDPRLYRVLQYAAPTSEERMHHYLWRFWRRLGRDGSATLFDRSWYGRVLVERVEGFASADEWQRAYAEINEFERQIVAHGSTMLKFWIHISPEEQYARFKARENEPHKQHKITDEDWRNREKWPLYESAVNEMILRTSPAHAPWHVIAGNNKRHARIEILKRFCEALES